MLMPLDHRLLRECGDCDIPDSRTQVQRRMDRQEPKVRIPIADLIAMIMAIERPSPECAYQYPLWVRNRNRRNARAINAAVDHFAVFQKACHIFTWSRMSMEPCGSPAG